MLAALWPAGRGVLSHDTALELHELCDVNPEKIHLTVPADYQPRRRGGERLCAS
jgi:predicted transcriptional regulator of viral defense system